MRQIIIAISVILILAFSACKGGEAKSTNRTSDVQTDLTIYRYSGNGSELDADTQDEVNGDQTNHAVDFTPYGTWELAETKTINEDGTEETTEVPEFEWLQPTLAIFPDGRMEANFYGTYYGQLKKIDVYNYEYINVELHSEGFVDQVEGPSTLQYLPETEQMRFLISGNVYYFTHKE
jgi:hypothetical protein